VILRCRSWIEDCEGIILQLDEISFCQRLLIELDALRDHYPGFVIEEHDSQNQDSCRSRGIGSGRALTSSREVKRLASGQDSSGFCGGTDEHDLASTRPIG
jgi:hypothetical protein